MVRRASVNPIYYTPHGRPFVVTMKAIHARSLAYFGLEVIRPGQLEYWATGVKKSKVVSTVGMLQRA